MADLKYKIPKMTFHDFLKLKELALNEFKDLPNDLQFKGSKICLSMEDKRILAFYASTLFLLNKKGVIIKDTDFSELYDIIFKK